MKLDDIRVNLVLDKGTDISDNWILGAGTVSIIIWFWETDNMLLTINLSWSILG